MLAAVPLKLVISALESVPAKLVTTADCVLTHMCCISELTFSNSSCLTFLSVLLGPCIDLHLSPQVSFLSLRILVCLCCLPFALPVMPTSLFCCLLAFVYTPSL